MKFLIDTVTQFQIYITLFHHYHQQEYQNIQVIFHAIYQGTRDVIN